jgi:GNAT superfamily N-acetyltransferase
LSIEFEIAELPPGQLDQYARLPIAFEVASVFDVGEETTDTVLLRQRFIQQPYLKDYDSIEGASPASWPSLFGEFEWQMFAAKVNNELVGGALAFVHPRDGERMMVLHDLRVSFDARRKGVGRALFRTAESWGRAKGCTALEVETQNINVPACKFYDSQGCKLREINRAAYAELPHEIQLLWRKRL